MISWIHFGDLHTSSCEERSLRDFVYLMDEANSQLASSIAFAVLPGDNADDGEEDQYKLVSSVLTRSRFPVYAIPGDHDAKNGGLDLYRRYLSDSLYPSVTMGAYHFLFLNSVADWQSPVFSLGREQTAWLREELRASGGKPQIYCRFSTRVSVRAWPRSAAATRVIHPKRRCTCGNGPYSLQRIG
jgi:Icc protein